jgi:hypothetical protein
MTMRLLLGIVIASGMAVSASVSDAAPLYLNKDNITVSVGAGTSDGSFNNTFMNGNTIEKVIDAPSADAEEFHNQNTHIWFTADEVGGGLELVFEFGQEYDISTLHFWNYTAESFDVDNVDFTFFNGGGTQVGTLSIEPALGSFPGIAAEDIPLSAPLNVETVNAFLTGSNRQVDFQNIGFTAQVSSPQPPSNDIPVPASIFFFAGGLIGVGAFAGRRRR